MSTDNVIPTRDLFLSISEIERLTGKKRPSAQIRWLINYGYKFAVNGLRQPIVTTEEVGRKLAGGPNTRKQLEPNWDAMAHR
jgi:hypothetical protein